MARPRKPAANKSFVTPEGVHLSESEIPLALPSYDKPVGQTLLDLIEANRPRDAAGKPIGVSLPGEEDEEEMEVFGPVMNTLVFVVPLTIVLLWFDVLVHIQYRQEIDWGMIFGRCIKAVPAISIIHLLFHPRKQWVSVRLFLLGMSVASGCFIVHAVNKQGYYFVMKKVPPLGVLWVWAVVEMDLVTSLLNVAAVAGFAWYYGYKLVL